MIAGKFFLLNEVPHPTQQYKGPVANSIYEILRIINGKPLFWATHFKRLLRSIQLNGWNFPLSEKEVLRQVQQLVELNQLILSNLRISINPNTGNRFALEITQPPTTLPSKELYAAGVNCGILKLERPRPNAKNVLPNVRKTVSKALEEQKVWELLLINQLGKITEGSRTNVFFIKDQTLITPPTKQVLPGITRATILNLAKNIGLEIKEEEVDLKDLVEFEGIFLSGTTPGAIAIKNVGNSTFAIHHPVYEKIKEAYRLAVENDVASFKYP